MSDDLGSNQRCLDGDIFARPGPHPPAPIVLRAHLGSFFFFCVLCVLCELIVISVGLESATTCYKSLARETRYVTANLPSTVTIHGRHTRRRNDLLQLDGGGAGTRRRAGLHYPYESE